MQVHAGGLKKASADRELFLSKSSSSEEAKKAMTAEAKMNRSPKRSPKKSRSPQFKEKSSTLTSESDVTVSVDRCEPEQLQLNAKSVADCELQHSQSGTATPVLSRLGKRKSETRDESEDMLQKRADSSGRAEKRLYVVKKRS